MKPKDYSLATKREAMRPIFEEGLTLTQAAAQVGCSVETLRQWKIRHKAKETGSPAPKRATADNDDTYTAYELAKRVGVSWQMIVAWRRSGKIPEHAITPDGVFRKAVIDPIIESGVLQRAEAPVGQPRIRAIRSGAIGRSGKREVHRRFATGQYGHSRS